MSDERVYTWEDAIGAVPKRPPLPLEHVHKCAYYTQAENGEDVWYEGGHWNAGDREVCIRVLRCPYCGALLSRFLPMGPPLVIGGE